MAISNSTTLNDLIGQIVSEETISAAYGSMIMRNLVYTKEVPLGAGSVVVPIFQELSEAGLAEGTAVTSSTWNSDGVTLTPVERGIYVQISKRVLHADPFSDLAPYGEQLGRALARGEDSGILGITGSGVWDTQVNADAGAFADADFREAIGNLEAADAPKPYYAVMHPNTWAGILTTYTNASAFAQVGKDLSEGYGEGYPSLNGYVASPYGIPTYISTMVPSYRSGASANWYGSMFSKYAIAYAYIKDIGVDVFDNVTARAFDLMAWRSADQSILKSAWGVALIDAI
jgi:hypothetical protein